MGNFCSVPPAGRKNVTIEKQVHHEEDAWLPSNNNKDEAEKIASATLTTLDSCNRILDVHATMSAANTELIFSTNGNWHKSLDRLLEQKFFRENPSVKRSYLITTTPPIFVPQMQRGTIRVGNVMWVDAQPHVVAGPLKAIQKLEEAGLALGDKVPIIQTYGCVILRRTGDHRIQTFWDLRNLGPGRFTTSHPAEGGSYNNYKNTTLNIAKHNPRTPKKTSKEADTDAQTLVSSLFHEGDAGLPRTGHIMHRSIPNIIATHQADAALCFLHIAVGIMRDNPGVFEAVYLARDTNGSTGDPDVLARGQDPVEGTQVATFFVCRTTTVVNDVQERARENFIESLRSDEFTPILKETGLRRPE